MPLTRFMAGGDKITIQASAITQTFEGPDVAWVTIATNIHACVIVLYANVNHAWGESRSHDVYRVMINTRTSKLLNLDYANTRFIWYDNGVYRTLRPIEDELPYGKRPRQLTVMRCEDVTDVELPQAT